MTNLDRIAYDAYQTYLGRGPARVQHFEHWSCPDAESYLTGVDFYSHPRQCRLEQQRRYPQLRLGIPEEDTPIPRPDSNVAGDAASHAVRWGAGQSWQWDWGHSFRDAEEALRFSPLGQGDFREIPVVESHDYRDEEGLYQMYRGLLPAEWGDRAPDDRDAVLAFYNTMFMWPLLTFGWEIFLEISLEPGFARIMEEFAEINRRVFRSIARTPANVVICHDDIVTSRGPVCSPEWMHKYIFPRYEEYWSLLRDSGKRVVFMADGCMDCYADDVFACGACGIITEPYTDFKALARRYPDAVLAGDGDNRVLSRQDPDEIRAMVASMTETARMSGGYFYCIGNHIPWDIPPASIQLYLDLCAESGWRS